MDTKVNYYAELLRDKNFAVSAYHSLKKLGVDAVPALLEISGSEKFKEVRIHIYAVIHAIGLECNIEFLGDLYNSLKPQLNKINMQMEELREKRIQESKLREEVKYQNQKREDQRRELENINEDIKRMKEEKQMLEDLTKELKEFTRGKKNE